MLKTRKTSTFLETINLSQPMCSVVDVLSVLLWMIFLAMHAFMLFCKL